MADGLRVVVVRLFTSVAGWVTDLVSPLGEHVTLLGSGSIRQDRCACGILSNEL